MSKKDRELVYWRMAQKVVDHLNRNKCFEKAANQILGYMTVPEIKTAFALSTKEWREVVTCALVLGKDLAWNTHGYYIASEGGGGENVRRHVQQIAARERTAIKQMQALSESKRLDVVNKYLLERYGVTYEEFKSLLDRNGKGLQGKSGGDTFSDPDSNNQTPQ